MNHNTAVFVMSFDGGQDLWKPFFTLFFKYWPDCPFPIYLQTNHLSYDDPRVKSLKLGPDQSFSDLLSKALAAIPEENILLFIDDFLMTQPVKTADVLLFLDLMKQRNASYFRLVPIPGPDKPLGQVGPFGFGSISKGQLFRSALQLALWRRQTLQSLIAGHESPREFEMRSNERCWKLPDEFLSITREPKLTPIPYYSTGVIHGYWVPEAVELCRRHGIEVDLSKRPLQPWHHRWAHGNRLVGMIRKIQWGLSERLRGVKHQG